MSSTARVRDYRERRWARLEELIRRVVREELALARDVDGIVDNRRKTVDNPVDKRYRDLARAREVDLESGNSLILTSGDAEDGSWINRELFPWAIRR